MGSEIIINEHGGGFTAAGVAFKVHLPGQPVITTSEHDIVIFKTPAFLRKYESVFESPPTANILEIGVAQGGSIIYFALAYPHLRFVGIDLRDPSDAVRYQIERLGLSDRVKLYYHVDQADTQKLHEIIRANFGDEPLGAVTEDDSHFYAPSKKTFESTFGLLAPKGLYCLEDWAWAHEPGPCQADMWLDQPALSNLLFEIIMSQPSRYDFVRSVRIDPELAFIERGRSASLSSFSLDDMILKRGKRLQLI